MKMNNYIYEYHQKIKDGSIVVGQWVKLLYEYIIDGLEKKEFFYDPKKAKSAIMFIETFCHHCEGRDDLLKLELWQKALISVMFGIVDKDNLRQFREVMLVVARKNGKSLLSAAIIAYMSFLDNEYGAKIYCLAPKLEQAEIVYNDFWQTIQKEPELKEMVKSRKSDYYIAETNTSIKKIAFNAKKSDGFNPHLVVCDEVASWVGDPGKKQYEVMKSALGARKQPMILTVSTAGYVNEGIFDELFARSTRFLLGNSKEKRLLPILYTIDDLDKWNDINELQKSNPNLGVSVSVDYLLEEIAIAEGSLSKKAEFIVKYCNIKQNSSQAWLSVKSVEKCFNGKPIEMKNFAHSYCVAGIDLSQTTDLTSACLLIENKKKLYCIAHFWMPTEKLQDAIASDGVPYDEMIQKGFLSLSGDNFVDYHDVFDWMKTAVEKYELLPLMTGYDRYSAQYLISDLNAYGFRTDDVYQGWNLHPVFVEMEGILKNGDLECGDNDLLKIHFLDAAMKSDTQSGKKKLIKITPKARVDGVAALSDAFCVRQKWYDEIGERLKNNS